MLHLSNIGEVYSPKYVWVWLLAAFKAGFINSAGFLATGNFVSHVTGFGTQVGIALGHHDFFFGSELLIIPVAYIAGGVITSLVLDGKSTDGNPPPYHLIQGFITLLIGLVIVLGETALGDFSPDTARAPVFGSGEFAVIGLLCLICGLKNSLVTWATGGKIRVTHLTGLSTDIGLNLIKMFRSPIPKKPFEGELTANTVRILIFFAFSFGACSSAMIFPQIGYKGFFLVMAMSLFMTGLSLWDRRKHSNVRIPNPAYHANFSGGMTPQQQSASTVNRHVAH